MSIKSDDQELVAKLIIRDHFDKNWKHLETVRDYNYTCEQDGWFDIKIDKFGTRRRFLDGVLTNVKYLDGTKCNYDNGNLENLKFGDNTYIMISDKLYHTTAQGKLICNHPFALTSVAAELVNLSCLKQRCEQYAEMPLTQEEIDKLTLDSIKTHYAEYLQARQVIAGTMNIEYFLSDCDKIGVQKLIQLYTKRFDALKYDDIINLVTCFEEYSELLGEFVDTIKVEHPNYTLKQFVATGMNILAQVCDADVILRLHELYFAHT